MTKNQRNKIYREALVVLRSYGKVFSFGICEIIDDLWEKHYPSEYDLYEPTVNAFEELRLLIPGEGEKETNPGSPYWWKDNDSRETALLFMIEMTK